MKKTSVLQAFIQQDDAFGVQQQQKKRTVKQLKSLRTPADVLKKSSEQRLFTCH